MMDRFTISNLEILHSKNEGGKSLIEIIDRTKTAMGSRLLRRWLCFPSIDIIEINKRYSIVDELKENYINNDEFVSQLKAFLDLLRCYRCFLNKRTPIQTNRFFLARTAIKASFECSRLCTTDPCCLDETRIGVNFFRWQ